MRACRLRRFIRKWMRRICWTCIGMRILGLEWGFLAPSRRRSNEARDSFEGLGVGWRNIEAVRNGEVEARSARAHP